MSKKEKAILPILLSQLCLPTIKRVWEDMAAEAVEKGWSGPEYLTKLCEQEVAGRESRRLKRHMAEAQFPRGKSIETFDFTMVTGVTKSKALALASGDAWVKDGMNILIFGDSGAGKTHLASAIGEKLVENGFRVLFTRTTEIVQKLQAAKKTLSLPSALDKLDKYDCLCLDDFGYVKKDESETSVLFELISERYERKSMIITCNQRFKDWDSIFLDKQMAIAAVDRLVHHATIIEIEVDESYRKKQALLRLKT
jgi:DNA replication protein DnaC